MVWSHIKMASVEGWQCASGWPAALIQFNAQTLTQPPQMDPETKCKNTNNTIRYKMRTSRVPSMKYQTIALDPQDAQRQ